MLLFLAKIKMKKQKTEQKPEQMADNKEKLKALQMTLDKLLTGKWAGETGTCCVTSYRREHAV